MRGFLLVIIMIYSADIQKLKTGNQIRLYELDATRFGASTYTSTKATLSGKANCIPPIQIEASGFDIRGAVQLRQPSSWLTS